MLGEITMVQLYSVALTAGKAHKDHKHHHVHHFDHDGQAITTQAPPTPAPRTNQPTHPLLTAGQINPMLELNLANQPQPQLVPSQLPSGQQFNAQLVNGQFVGSLVSQQLLSTASQGQAQQSIAPQGLNFGGNSIGLAQSFSQSSQLQQPLQQTHPSRPLAGSGLVHPSLTNPANVQFIDSPVSTHQLFKRNNKEEAAKKVNPL